MTKKIHSSEPADEVLAKPKRFNFSSDAWAARAIEPGIYDAKLIDMTPNEKPDRTYMTFTVRLTGGQVLSEFTVIDIDPAFGNPGDAARGHRLMGQLCDATCVVPETDNLESLCKQLVGKPVRVWVGLGRKDGMPINKILEFLAQ
jgi:hypothetical protein